jgi:hypothetical protein
MIASFIREGKRAIPNGSIQEQDARDQENRLAIQSLKPLARAAATSYKLLPSSSRPDGTATRMETLQPVGAEHARIHHSWHVRDATTTLYREISFFNPVGARAGTLGGVEQPRKLLLRKLSIP